MIKHKIMKNKFQIRWTLISILILFNFTGSLWSQSCTDDPCPNPPCAPSPPCLLPPCNQVPQSGADLINSLDPNDIIPPNGIPDEGWIRKDRELTYMILFENLPTATASAQRVEVTVSLEPTVDYGAFSLEDFGFYFYYFEMPFDTNAFMEVYPVDDFTGVDVEVTAFLDSFNQQAIWVFQSLDTISGLPPLDPLAGFLPPNDTLTGNGEGFIGFTVRPHPNSQTFDEINTFASIVFDENDPINTPTSLLTIDDDPPVSGIDTIFYNPDSLRYQVVLNGSDIGSGVKNYTLFRALGDQKFEPIVERTEKTNIFMNLTVDSTYHFITMARDSVDLLELPKDFPDYTYTPPRPTNNILLTEGWNLISAYFDPSEPDMLDIFAPIEETVIIAKDYQGTITVPSIPLNAIGFWNLKQGYQVKVTEDVILPIEGNQIRPEITPVPIKEGWQILPYLRNQPGNLQEELSDINWSTIIIKDNFGNIYYPSMGIDNIQTLFPTQGYWMKSLSNGYLYYSVNTDFAETTINPLMEETTFFVLPEKTNTGANASFIIPYEVLMNSPVDYDDEIGIFTEQGTLVGSAIFTGESMAFPIWSDDLQTTSKEGLSESETFVMRIYDQSEEEAIEEVLFTIEGGLSIYFNNEIYIVNNIELAPTSVQQPAPDVYFKYYPNPTSGRVNFSLGLQESADVQLIIHSLDGKVARSVANDTYTKGLHEFSEDLSDLPDGLYLIRVISGKTGKVYKLVMSH
jgi:hypothetical protein